MQIYDSLEQLAELHKPVHWAMGFFDGVHRGHLRVIKAAHSPGALCGVLTFDRHPLALLRPESAPSLLTPDAAYKAWLLESQGGVDVLLRLPFTADLAATSAVDFLKALGRACCVAGISVGANWHFGCGGVGTPDLLRREGLRQNFAVNVQPLAETAGIPVSSSRTRAELAAGRLGMVAQLLGRPFALVGQVQHGQRLARELGFPTANIHVSQDAALPPFGVYRVRCCVDGMPRMGIANLGLRPTIVEQQKIPRLEVHLPGWQGDLYGQRLVVELLELLRLERAFSSLEELKAQMRRDLAALNGPEIM